VIAGGRVGMMPMTTLDAGNVHENAPDVDLGATLFPYAEGLGSPGSASWLGGWNLFVPREAQYPDAAWDFLQFATATDEGTTANYEAQKAVPGLAHVPALAELAADPRTAIFSEVLLTCQNVRPTIPVAGTYAQQLDVNVGRAIFGQLTPQQALKQVADVVNAEWDAFRKEHP
jgi:multiple sugar transport system substrate-binding protein